MSFGSRSLPPPTPEESERMAKIHDAGCVACLSLHGGLERAEVHHLLVGHLRAGHRFTIGLCPWHHRGIQMPERSFVQMTDEYGPSLAKGSRVFHQVYGPDQELLDFQDRLLRYPLVTIQRARRGKSTARPAKVIAR